MIYPRTAESRAGETSSASRALNEYSSGRRPGASTNCARAQVRFRGPNRAATEKRGIILHPGRAKRRSARAMRYKARPAAGPQQEKEINSSLGAPIVRANRRPMGSRRLVNSRWLMERHATRRRCRCAPPARSHREKEAVARTRSAKLLECLNLLCGDEKSGNRRIINNAAAGYLAGSCVARGYFDGEACWIRDCLDLSF